MQREALPRHTLKHLNTLIYIIIMNPTPQQIANQNRLYYARQKLKTSSLLGNAKYGGQEMPELVSKYNGYMQLYRRKQGQTQPTEYFTSSFLNDLRDKRNSTFSDEIIKGLTKQYDLTEYASNVDWRNIATNGVDLSKTKFVGGVL